MFESRHAFVAIPVAAACVFTPLGVAIGDGGHEGEEAAAAKRSRTEQKTFHAFDADGNPTVRISRTRDADSCSDSYVNQQPSARRCFSGNFIHDPCFIDPGDDDRGVCVESPHARTGLRLRGMYAADDGFRIPPSRRPWALDLRGGQKCTFISGASGARGNRRLNYGCDDRSFLWGVPRRTTRFWTILRSKTYDGRWRRARIAVAWK